MRILPALRRPRRPIFAGTTATSQQWRRPRAQQCLPGPPTVLL